MNRKTILLATLLVLLGLLLVACGGGEADCASEDVFCVGLVTDVGEIDDKSFNQSAYEGVKRAEAELGPPSITSKPRMPKTTKPTSPSSLTMGMTLSSPLASPWGSNGQNGRPISRH